MSAQDNIEWQLADVVDAIAAEVDRAEDTLLLKSYSRKVTFSIKKISLDAEVTLRRDLEGRLFFRAVDPGQTSDTLLKLDFAQVLESQLAGLRHPMEDTTTNGPLAKLPGITLTEIRALNAIGIYSVDDLLRYTRTSSMLAEVSRKTDLPETKLRDWRGLPYFTLARPARGTPGSTVVLEGGNLGLVRPAGSVVMFHGREAQVLDWSSSRVTVEVPPEARGAGLVFAVLGAQPSNVIAWESTVPDLLVEELRIGTEVVFADEPFDVEALVANPGALATSAFKVQWSVDGAPVAELPHGPLEPGQRSAESSIRRQLQLGQGTHTVRFVADTEGTVPGEDRARRAFTRTVRVRPRQALALGDFRVLSRLDPLRAGPMESSSLMGLVFRGLGRRDGPQGEAVPDLAEAWSAPQPVDVGGTRRYAVTATLRGDVHFHDGTPVTAEDVRFSFQRMREQESPWRAWAARVLDVTLQGRQVTFLLDAPDALTPLLSAGIVPRTAYEADPQGFGSKPVGSGPFVVERLGPDAVELRAFRAYFRGTPRLDRVSVAQVPDLDRLGERLEQQELLAAVMPYDQAWFERLRDLGEWHLTRVVAPNGEELLHAQSPLLLERQPQARDLGGGAHLWYFRD
ncbi:ABC transporter substrate-binding protein [Corallococcus sp. AS-1-6]|uniref:ABC transporter substrate-binding protein n=1 Tax=Corallococcus sp. AS-1-6 TaxID=2874599 RepID=UPI001CC05529|nr:ABC transporter substrate-binding protein [Corallococcus sp. AS-1-6]MBZ4373457.1 hypothetical protein [Corallococcus sp. AS-1-6]